mmetsp:Transcript_38173/g.107864  ORF Transcript_38173/g.107864 Transcript_38173/m.107864 type:complete len:565 (+) Transcript_38173:240-1934(+)
MAAAAGGDTRQSQKRSPRTGGGVEKKTRTKKKSKGGKGKRLPHSSEPEGASLLPDDTTGSATSTFELNHGEAATIRGYAQLRVLGGEVWLAGRRLTPSSEPVDVLVGGEAADCAAVEGVGSPPQVPHARTSARTKLELRSIGPCRSKHTFSVTTTQSSRGISSRAEGVIYPGSWRQAAEGVAAAGGAGQGKRAMPPPVVAVAGSKGAGKSTFARLLVNTLLNRWPEVAYVDTDAGQPEFTPPGLVSVHMVRGLLVGPPHEHQRCSCKRAAFVGDISPASEPEGYLAAVTGLLAWVRSPQSGFGAMPMVINTHGWVKGLGMDTLALILQAAQPSHVVQLACGVPSRDLPSGLWWAANDGAAENVCAECIPSAKSAAVRGKVAPPPDSTGRTAAGDRALRWAAWAHLCSGPGLSAGLALVGSESPGAFSPAATLLAELPPYAVPLDAFPLRFRCSTVPKGEELTVANGAVVGLMGHASGGGGAPCLGLGLIRGIDAPRGTMYILTPSPPGVLAEVAELHVGVLEIPPQLLQCNRYSSPYLSAFCLAAEGTGAGKMKSRNSLVRRAA